MGVPQVAAMLRKNAGKVLTVIDDVTRPLSPLGTLRLRFPAVVCDVRRRIHTNDGVEQARN